MVKAKLVKKKSFFHFQPISSRRQIDQDCLVPVISLWLGCVTPVGEVSTEQWQCSGLSWTPKVWLQKMSHLNLFICIQRSWGAPARQLPCVFGLEVMWHSLAVREALCHPLSQGTGAVPGAGSVPRSLQPAGWIPYVHHGMGASRSWLSCADQFGGYVLRGEVTQGSVGVWKRGKTVGLWVCQLLDVLWELAVNI